MRRLTWRVRVAWVHRIILRAIQSNDGAIIAVEPAKHVVKCTVLQSYAVKMSPKVPWVTIATVAIVMLKAVPQ